MSTPEPLPSERSAFVPPAGPGGTAVLLLTCPDARGIVAAVAEFLYRHGANIVEVEQHTDASDGLFFQRVEFELDGLDLAPGEVLPAFREVSDRFAMEAELRLTAVRPRIALLASKQPHCLLDLLSRHHSGELDAELTAVVSNHPDHAEASRFFGVPFHHVPIGPDGKAAQEARVLEAVGDVDLVVLARYMQVLSADFVGRFPSRIINIHHSLLPAFVGAKPYHQAHDRGVKIIGATAHYATADLDEGPIIAQDISRVTHRDSVEQFVARGRDLEALVLARAVRLHLAARVLVHRGRTVVFG